ncbi:MAG: hypothetical protein BJ554DRAFT_2567 [Olpidium bornovanus]|uniref:Uncharacterized protein n=1 Tax=Olpidium bornovanus TaxID=278681 RepID=A0A8H7ZQ88_9FUNG|nr:MAG: hypothetical protein BJ554DRAFT_2567 [Olpidium bornovanus]
MKLAASLLALVAAAPALVSAAPSRDCVHHSATPGPAGSDDGLGIWRNVLADALQDHINLAKQTVDFIANNFDNPPSLDVDKMKTSAILGIPDSSENYFHDKDFDYAEIRDLLLSESPSDEDIIRKGILEFKTANFNIAPNGNRLHVLSEGNPFRAERLWKFYSGVWSFLNPRPAEWSSPPVPDILRSVDGDRPNLRALLTNDAVRDFLAFVADELSRAARENFGARNSADDVYDWVSRVHLLDRAISGIHLYDDDPLIYHGDLLIDLLEFVISEPDAGPSEKPDPETLRRVTQVIIGNAAKAVKAVCSL